MCVGLSGKQLWYHVAHQVLGSHLGLGGWEGCVGDVCGNEYDGDANTKETQLQKYVDAKKHLRIIW